MNIKPKNISPNLIVAHKDAINGDPLLIKVSFASINNRFIFSITSKIPAINSVVVIFKPIF